jgi:hypothetical protein
MREDSYTSNRAMREDSGSSSRVAAREDSGSSSHATREGSGSSSRVAAVGHNETLLQQRAVGIGSRVMVDAANLMLTAAAPACAFDGMMAKVTASADRLAVWRAWC